MKNTLTVAAALIVKGDKFFVCRRPENKDRALLWEFVGGKAEQGETLRETLRRECCEELGAEIAVGGEFCTVNYEYEDVFVKITVFLADVVAGKIQLLEHSDGRWVTAQQAEDLPFCPADKEILKRIKRFVH